MARRRNRCSVCSSSRVVMSNGELGACTFIQCKDPMHDFDKELRSREYSDLRGALEASKRGHQQSMMLWCAREQGILAVRNEALDVIGRLVRAMDVWGSQEDGVPEAGPGPLGEIGKAYEEAKRLLKQVRGGG